ncbi:hypothetical protein FRC01_002297 [Tulasnella sp. 417]|nr:hypothetical protein FRC01_002297 [Tulasnella sp. 417]
MPTMMLVKIAIIVVAGVALAPAATVTGLGWLGFSAAGPVAGTAAAGIQSAVYGGVVGSGSLFAMAQSDAMGGVAVSATKTAADTTDLVGAIAMSGCITSDELFLNWNIVGYFTVARGYYAMPSSPEYPGTNAYLQLVQQRLTGNPDYVQLFVLLSRLHTYITMTDTSSLQLNLLRDRFIAVMEEANRMKAIIEADQPVKDADLAFRAEMLTLLGQQKIREDEAKARAEAEANNKNRWFAAAAGGALLTVGAVVVGPALAVGALNLVGFSSVGPVAGSLAATIQSIFYGGAVGSGSLFALCQSAAMGGIVVGSAAEIAAGVAALGAGAGLLGGMGPGSPDNNEDGAAGPNNRDGPRIN